jgi:hypothetical protein
MSGARPVAYGLSRARVVRVPTRPLLGFSLLGKVAQVGVARRTDACHLEEAR